MAAGSVNSILARLPNVTRWLDNVRPDVLCMQETKCADDKFPFEVFQERGYNCITFGQQSYNGVAIASLSECQNLRRGYDVEDEASQARLLTTTVAGIKIVNVY